MTALAVLDGVLITFLVMAGFLLYYMRKGQNLAHEVGRAKGHAEGYQSAVEHISRGVDLAKSDQSKDGPSAVPVQRPDS